MTSEDDIKLAEMYMAWCPFSEIAASLGITEAAARQRRKRLGLPARHPQRQKAARPTPQRLLRDMAIEALILAGHNDHYIADAVGLHHWTIWSRRKKLGLPPSRQRRYGVKRAAWEAARAGEARA